MTEPSSAHPLRNRETPGWYDEAKLGIFVHWNAAAIPAFAPVTNLTDLADDPSGAATLRCLPYAEMYWNTMLLEDSPTQQHHATTYPGVTYEDFVRQFRDECIPQWSPASWADLFAMAGARYVVLTTKTEDGFLLWPSAHPNPHRAGWQSERDVVGDLAEAVRAAGLRLGTYYSGGRDWTFGGLPSRTWQELNEAMPEGGEYAEYVQRHWIELIDRYQPSILWNDYSYPVTNDQEALFTHYFSTVADGVVNNRFQPDMTTIMEPSPVYSDFVTPEYSTEGSDKSKWEACRGMGTSFGFNRLETEDSYLSATELVHTLVDIVARGGNLLINVGPTSSGQVPWLQAERLLSLGWWLRRNGEAIYGTRPWVRYGGMTTEALPVRFTRTRESVYATVLGTPANRIVDLPVQLGEDVRVESLEHGSTPLTWRRLGDATAITLPEEPDAGRPTVAFRLTPVDAVLPSPSAGGPS